MFTKGTVFFYFAIAMALYANDTLAEEFALCKFNDQTLSFRGDLNAQAKCLLRSVNPQGSGSKVQPIPAFLSDHIGQPIEISRQQLADYLDANDIPVSAVGGSPFDPVSHATGKDGITKPAMYLVIHDTSSPEIPQADGFPPNINDSTWSANRVGPGYWNSMKRLVNIVISRAGESHTFNDFSKGRPGAATKLEFGRFAEFAKGRFLHVENVQPRLKPINKWAHIAPVPGFSDKQLERLALVYVAASVRAERWILPAFHFNIDHKIAPDLHAHDDPQNFVLSEWGDKLEKVVNGIKASVDKRAGLRPPTVSCKPAPLTVHLNRGSNDKVKLPASGKLFGEGHFVTTEDNVFAPDKYPKRMSPQPTGYPEPYQCNQHIDQHLERSLALYKMWDANMTKDALYPDKWALWWTPEEGGRCGQGSVGDAQLRELTPEMEMWFFTMNWKSGMRPDRGTKFLVSANGRNVVTIAGYETGPGSDSKLGGVTREVHGWLGSDNDSDITVSYLADQDVPIGPVTCAN